MTDASSIEVARKKHGRSRLTNDASLLPGVDMRSTIGRRFKDVTRAIIQDQGGVEAIAEVRLALIRRFSAGVALAEMQEARMVAGEDIDPLAHCQIASTLCRIAARLGLNRRTRQLPTLSEYLDAPPAATVEIERVSEDETDND